MSAKRWLPLLAATLLLAAVPASGTIGPPCSVRPVGKLRLARPGELYEAAFEITVARQVELSAFRLRGGGWSVRRFDAPALLTLDKGAGRRISFAAIPSDPVEPLVLEFRIGGRPVRKVYDLSPGNHGLSGQPIPTVQVPPRGPVPEPELGRRHPLPLTLTEAEAGSAAPAGPTTYSIRVHGRFVYTREDNVDIGAMWLKTQVIDMRVEVGEVQAVVATGMTDVYGYYDLTFDYTPSAEDPLPDLAVAFYSFNDEVRLWNNTFDYYTFVTGTVRDFAGSDLDFGTGKPAIESYFKGLHILTDVSRAWLYCEGAQGMGPGLTTVMWPDDDWPNYTPVDQIIHIPAFDWAGWRERTHVHEFGHHWVNHFAANPTADYCNPGGWCDEGECGHCEWCEENESVAWMEGFPDFMSYLIPGTFQAEYGQAALYVGSYETPAFCDTASHVYHDPQLTEGFLAAVLQDLHDASGDAHGIRAGTRDVLSLPASVLFEVAHFDLPHTPQGFLEALLAEAPASRADIWETAANCGYELDTDLPGTVMGLTSTSHTPGVSSQDPTVDLVWAPAPEGTSGLDGYAVMIAPAPGLPPAIKTIGNVTTFTTAVLATGTHYICLRAVDRAGSWSPDYAVFGPVVIGAASAADLEFATPVGWVAPVVPRSTADATLSNCTASATLSTLLYGNLSVRNAGASPATDVSVWLRLCGKTVWGGNLGNLAGSSVGCSLNNSIWAFYPTGRQVCEGWVDPLDTTFESDENDNHWGRQWVLTPADLTAGTPLQRAAPPPRTGGWESVVDGSPVWYNCDGVRFRSTALWNAVILRNLEADENYDCRLHPASTGCQDGFAANLGYSTAPAGYLDILVVNRNTTGIYDWDVGLLNSDPPGAGDDVVLHVVNGYRMIGDSLTVHFDADEMLRLWDFQVGAGGPWPLLIRVTGDPQTPVWALYLDQAYTTGCPLTNYDGYATTLGSGQGTIRIDAAQEGRHCLVVYRNPIHGTGPIDVTVEIEEMPPNFQPLHAAGWYNPLVPRNAADGTPSLVPAPDTLRGDLATTYLNLALVNRSAAAAPFLHGHIYQDGAAGVALTWNHELPADGQMLLNDNEAEEITGGRHTLAVRLDDQDELEELSEIDNDWGEQFCWAPTALPGDASLVRAAPPERTGGWSEILTGEPRLYNCDGVRLPPDLPTWWWAVAVMPGSGSDVDVRLHEPLSGTKDGFAATLAYSGWGSSESDYVLVNRNLATHQPYDAGVLRLGTTTASYTVEAARAPYVSFDGDEVYGPFTVAAGRILHLTEFLLAEGPLQVTVENVSGSVDWGLTVHPADEPYLSKSDALPGGSSWLAAYGMDETVTVTIPAYGYYCVAVWKRNAVSLGLNGTFQLRVTRNVTGAPDDRAEIPERTALGTAWPNPFNPTTTIPFALAGSGPVRLAVYDLAGRLVRLLVAEHLPAGPHAATWDGRDEVGRPAPAGGYLYRLQAGGLSETRKMTLVR